jgi:hypothetical protein
VTCTLGVDWKTWETLLAAQLGPVDHLHRRRDLLQVLGLARGRDDDFCQLGLLLDRGGAAGLSVRGWRYGLTRLAQDDHRAVVGGDLQVGGA